MMKRREVLYQALHDSQVLPSPDCGESDVRALWVVDEQRQEEAEAASSCVFVAGLFDDDGGCLARSEHLRDRQIPGLAGSFGCWLGVLARWQ